jgi:L-ascorbate metabolism protein UlaG (beta-lactamase superfamily)
MATTNYLLEILEVKRVIIPTLFILKIGFLFFALSGCSRSFDKFWNDRSNLLPAVEPTSHQTEMRFFGVSSFLIREGNDTMMIDGYTSRPRGAIFRPIQPELTAVHEILDSSRIGIKRACANTISKERDLDAIVAMHGHFDHALDTSVIAALTGATLVSDEFVNDIDTKTRALFPGLCPIEKRIEIQMENQKTKLDLGNLVVSLVHVKHSTNPASFLLEKARSDPNWAFPTRAKNLKEGASLAAHVQTQNGSLIIIPTAGDVGTSLTEENLHADVIFLAIGGLGWGSRAQAEKYWADTVLASGAKRVVPIHWDSMSPALDPDLPKLNAPVYEQLDRALGWLEEFSDTEPQIDLVSVPIIKPFNPFSIATFKGAKH